jgi:surface polysaccharide O-acyltransferase-like enzyme
MKRQTFKSAENKNVESNNRIAMIAPLSFVLSIMVVFIHNSTFAYYHLSNNPGIINNLFSNVIPRVAVPLFFLISSFLFYRNFNYSDISRKYKSRLNSLFIPYLFWNIISMVFAALITYLPFVSSLLSGRELFDPSVISILSGIFLRKYYVPFWFIENLIIFTIFCPIIYSFLKQKYIGAIVVVSVGVLYGFGIELPRSIFYDGSSMIYYLIGSYLGIHYKSVINIKLGRKSHIIGIIGTIMSIVLLFLYPEDSVPGIIRVLILLMYCFSFWLVFDFFTKYIKDYWWLSLSFIVFATHLYLQPIIAKLIYIVFPDNIIFAVINYFISPFISIIVMIIISKFLRKFLPSFWKIISGSR